MPNDFLELNDLQQPHELDEMDFEQLQEMLNPVIQNQLIPGAEVVAAPFDLNLPIADSDSDLTVTISLASSHSSEEAADNDVVLPRNLLPVPIQQENDMFIQNIQLGMVIIQDQVNYAALPTQSVPCVTDLSEVQIIEKEVPWTSPQDHVVSQDELVVPFAAQQDNFVSNEVLVQPGTDNDFSQLALSISVSQEGKEHGNNSFVPWIHLRYMFLSQPNGWISSQQNCYHQRILIGLDPSFSPSCGRFFSMVVRLVLLGNLCFPQHVQPVHRRYVFCRLLVSKLVEASPLLKPPRLHQLFRLSCSVLLWFTLARRMLKHLWLYQRYDRVTGSSFFIKVTREKHALIKTSWLVLLWSHPLTRKL